MAHTSANPADRPGDGLECPSIETRIANEIVAALTCVVATSERAFAIEVRLDQGQATLTGTVDKNYQKIAAGHYAARVSGVLEVINRIEVAPPGALGTFTGPSGGYIEAPPRSGRNRAAAVDDGPGCPRSLRYRYRTRIILGTWHSSRRAAVDDALRAGLAVRTMRGPGGLRWTVPGAIEKAGAPLVSGE